MNKRALRVDDYVRDLNYERVRLGRVVEITFRRTPKTTVVRTSLSVPMAEVQWFEELGNEPMWERQEELKRISALEALAHQAGEDTDV